MKNRRLLILAAVIFLFMLPFFLSPNFLASQNNDLGRTYIPLFSFYKSSIINFQQIPLWRPEQLMGETFISSPLPALFYPGNLIFLIFPVSFAAVLYYFL